MSSRGGRGGVNYTHAIKLWESFPQDNSESLPVGEEGLWPADRLPSREEKIFENVKTTGSLKESMFVNQIYNV